MDPKQVPVESLGQAGAAFRTGPAAVGEGFQKVLRERLTGLKFSAHAEERIERRRIALTVNDLERLKEAVQRAEAKGSRDSLVLVDDKAFVVSIKNKTVITALSGSSVKEGVFTNIDSAVVV
ncbi:MAG: hypothetical protein D6679_00420 [Candidatus Hydrogenedentota bacterium]|nr:MAG: hypothetical protein D6679_00420 [Candidatus Hydrogenedentota bacterium]